MAPFVFWTMAGLIASGLGFASIDTQALMQAAGGLEKAGLIGEKPISKKLPAPASGLAQVPALLPSASAQSIDITQRLDTLSSQVAQVWGADQVLLPSESQVVKYSADMRSRSIIDLKDGKLIVETLVDAKTEFSLHQALTQALLTPNDPRQVDVLSTQPSMTGTKPFLLGQLVDSLGKPIDSLERAQKFAAWALVNRSQTLTTPVGKVQRIELALDANHKQVRAARFAMQLEAAAKQYDVDVNLLYAITETESHFNPFAVSHSGALGLMQLVPSRAGRDAMKAALGVDRDPTWNELTDPSMNIRLGAAYLAMLSSRYLGDVKHPQSREYAVIAAYNGGSSRALRVFGNDKEQSIAMLNQLPPQIVYDSLKTRHASSETRGYVEKVTTAKKRYSTRV